MKTKLLVITTMLVCLACFVVITYYTPKESEKYHNELTIELMISAQIALNDNRITSEEYNKIYEQVCEDVFNYKYDECRTKVIKYIYYYTHH
jgi:hypothetical protein